MTIEYTRQISEVMRNRADFVENEDASKLLNTEFDAIEAGFVMTRQVPYIVPSAGRYIRSEGATGTTTSTRALDADTIDLAPWIPLFDFTADRMACNVTTAAATSKVKLLVYSSDVSGKTDQLLIESSELDCSTTGAKEATIDYDFKKGVQYWVGLRCNTTTPTLSVFQSYTSVSLDTSGVETGTRKRISRSLSYATASPTTWVYNHNETDSGNAASIWFRIG